MVRIPCSRRLVRLVLAACLSVSLLIAAHPSAAPARPPTDSFEGLVDVGGHSLYVKCMGRGGPTVILESGLGSPLGVWELVQPAVAHFTTVCAYDRTNIGRSDRVPGTRTSQTAVDELRALLRNAGIRGPYVLVGHSLGAYHVQLFARQDGGRRVTGVVLVDATPIDWPDVLDRFGIPTPTPAQNPEGVDIRASAREVLAAPAFPNVPLVALARTVFPPAMPAAAVQAWQERQLAHSRLSCRGELVEVAGAGHFVHRDRPDAVIAAIERVVEAAGRTRARRIHPRRRPSRGEPRGGARRGKWSKCPDAARASSKKTRRASRERR